MTARKKASKPAARKSPPTTPASKGEDICFCIMPFGGYFDDYFDTIYQPAIAKSGLVAKRADDLYRPSTIVNDIWHYTQNSTIVLADLTGKNPNVFYELGLAHALAKPAILIVNDIEDVPFDLRALRIIEYDKNDPRWGDVLHDKIVKSITELKDAPLDSVLPTFLKVDKSAGPPRVSEEDKTLLELRRDLDMMKRELRSLDRPLSRHEAMLDPEQAEDLIKEYMRAGMSDSLIVSRFVRRGAPRPWVEERISDLRGQPELPIEKG